MPSHISITFAPAPKSLEGAILVPVFAKKEKGKSSPKIGDTMMKLDRLTNGAVKHAALNADFTAALGTSVVVRHGGGVVVLMGAGEELKAGVTAEDFGGHIATAISRAGIKKSATLLMDSEEAAILHGIGLGAILGGYHFPDYFTKGERTKKSAGKKAVRLTIASAIGNAAGRGFKAAAELAEGVFLARDLAFEPANALYPETFARRCKPLTQHGVKVKVLDEAAMKKQGMNLLLSVGQGSRRASRMVVMRYDGGKRGAKPVALIGKGVCFDSGGISIKPAGGMEDMKWDMGGAGAVVGAMRALAGRGAGRNIVGLIGLVENMPDGNATRPGDVVKSMSGQTVEIINTDAEGRLVLADLLTYTLRHHKPIAMVNLATLTGAIIVALGHEHAGVFSNDDALADGITAAGEATGEKAWRMPLGKEYHALLRSHIADMKNIGGRWGGAVTAACFLERFVEKTPWAHIDIAGMAWGNKARPTVPKGGTGYGVRLLTRLVEDGIKPGK